jgi:beta-glucanase (GH16 family)
MRIFLLISLSFISWQCQFEKAELICPIDYEIVLEDQFNTDTLNTQLWQTHTINPAPFNRIPPRSYCNYDGAEIFLDENVIIKNGHLIIKTTNDKYRFQGITGGEKGQDIGCKFIGQDSFDITNLSFTSGNITTKTSFQYGYFEARIKIPEGKGVYPVIWLWGMDEIVMFEFFGETQNHSTSIHRGGQYEQKIYSKVQNYADDFHLYAVEWTPEHVRWYFDGNLLRTVYKYFDTNGKGVSCAALDSNKTYIENPLFPKEDRVMVMNLSVNIHDGNRPDETTLFPTYLKCDYIRILQKKESVN